MSPETLTPPAWRHRLTWPGIPTPWPSHPSTIIHRESRRHTRTASIFRETVRPHRLAAAVDSTAVSPLIRECTRGTRRSLIRDFPSDSPITGSKPPINLGEPKWVSAVQYRIGTSSNPIPYRSRALRGTMVPLRPRAQSLLWQDRDPMWAMPATRQRTLTRILQPNSMCTHMMEVVCYRTNLPTPSPYPSHAFNPHPCPPQPPQTAAGRRASVCDRSRGNPPEFQFNSSRRASLRDLERYQNELERYQNEKLFDQVAVVLPGCDERIRRVMRENPRVTDLVKLVDLVRSLD